MSHNVHPHTQKNTDTQGIETNTRLLSENPAVSSRACFWRVMTLAVSLVYSSLSPLLFSPQSGSLHSLFAVLFRSLLNSTHAAFSGGFASRHDCVAQSNYTQQGKNWVLSLSITLLSSSSSISLSFYIFFSPLVCSFIFPGYI